MWRFLLVLFISYLLLVVVGTHLTVIPDLLVVMIIFSGPASLWRSTGYGFLTGALLDLSTGLGLYHTVIYTVAGVILGIMPATIFQTNITASLVNTVLGTLIIHLGYALLAKIFEHHFFLMPWHMLLAHILINSCIVWLLLMLIAWNKGKIDEIY
jgi:hypothetical protein